MLSVAKMESGLVTVRVCCGKSLECWACRSGNTLCRWACTVIDMLYVCVATETVRTVAYSVVSCANETFR